MKIIIRARALLATLSTSIFLLAGCGGGGGAGLGSANSPQPVATGCTDTAGCGSLFVSMTDADGDFLNYTVDVVSLKLKRANGTIVETLPNQTRVDFSQYVDVSEFVTAATIPNGDYVEGTLRLDYSHADVSVEKNGLPVAANVVDANGAALGVVDVRVVLDNRNHLVVAPGRPALLTLDFNLVATNTVDVTTTPVTVKARPTLIASLEPVQQKDLRLRGPLVSVDTSAGTYLIDVRPFNHPRAKHGRVTVHATATTTFEINGQSSVGAAGLQALAAAGADTATIAFGTLVTADKTLTADRVYAGTSVPGQGMDAVIGTVVSRIGNELTVRGGIFIRNDASNPTGVDDRASFDRGEIKVLIGPNTKVLKDGSVTQTFGPEAVSVGQLINVFGNAPQATTNSTSTTVNAIDATQGRVRMHLTHLLGTVVSNSTGLLTLDLDSINGRRVGAFNFAGTGKSTAQDADPKHYEIQTPLAMITQVIAGKPMRVFGFVMPFGAAPPDFESKTLVSYAELSAELSIGWGDAGTAAPFSMLNGGTLNLSLANTEIGLRHFLRIGPLVLNLGPTTPSPNITGALIGETMFVIVTSSGIDHYSNFTDYVAALMAKLNGTAKMVSFNAEGSYDATGNTFTAKAAVAIFR